MKEITGEEFKRQLESLESDYFQDYTVICTSVLQLDLREIIWKIYLKNIIFKGQPVIFTYANPEIQNQEISFEECCFHNKLIFQKCICFSLRFEHVRLENDFRILDSNIKHLNLINLTAIDSEFSIKDTEFKEFFILNCDFTLNTIDFYSIKTETLFGILDSKLRQVKLRNSVFSNDFNYYNNHTLGSGNETFFECRFTDASFASTVFSNNVILSNNVFEGRTSFATIEGKNSEITISNSTINGECYFDRSNVKSLYIRNTKFVKDVSFQESKFDTIKLKKLIFGDIVFFDDIKIRKVFQCDRNSLRTIKQQLQKADNKIDYNRFRAYELSAYYRELQWNWKDGKDKFILGATWLVTGFDHSWRRALGFSLAAAAVFYTLFYISENYYLHFDLSQWQQFLSGYFRFLLITDFYNPLADGRSYINNTNTIGWLIFILGKIVIAFGIYEMIQAFRKFKA